MIEIWMKNHLVSDNNCKHSKFRMPMFFYKERQLNYTFRFSVGDTIMSEKKSLHYISRKTSSHDSKCLRSS